MKQPCVRSIRFPPRVLGNTIPWRPTTYIQNR